MNLNYKRGIVYTPRVLGEFKMQKNISRRQFLKRVGIATASTSLDFSNLVGIPRIVQKVPDYEYSTNQLFVASNKLLQKGVPTEGYCYFIGHAGYGDHHKGEIVQDAVANVKRFGKYAPYLNNISRLVHHLRGSNELTLFAAEKVDYEDSSIPREALRPFDSSMILVTENGEGIPLVDNLNTRNGSKKQRVDLLFSFLKKSDVKEIRVAGEWTYWVKQGCLAELAYLLSESFEIKGIEDCIFPTKSTQFKREDLIKYNSVLKKLYENQVPLESIIK